MRRRWLVAAASLLVACTVALAPAAEATTPARQVVLLLVPDSSWKVLPPLFDGWAKGNVAIATANGGHRIIDSYFTISKGGRAGGLGSRFGTGSLDVQGERVRLLDWARFVHHDDSLRFGGHLGTLGQAIADAGVDATVVAPDTPVLSVLADRGGLVRHAVLGGGTADVVAAVDRGTRLVVSEVDAAALPLVLDRTSGACVLVASITMPPGRSDLGAIAASRPCGLGTGGLVSASTRQPDYVMLGDLLPTVLERLGLPENQHDEAAPIRGVAGTRHVHHLIDLDERARISGQAEGWFNGVAVGAALLGLFATQMSTERRRRIGTMLLAMPVSMLLIDVVPWWRADIGGGVILAVVVPLLIGTALTAALRERPRLVVAILVTATALVIGIDAATGGHLQLDSGVANNAIGAGRFAGMGNVPYGFFVASCILATGLALERWGRRAVPLLLIGLAAAVAADGAPFFGADVGGVLAAMPAFALLLLGWRRSLPVRRLAVAGVSGVLVLAAFAAFDISRPAGSRTHLGRTLTNGGAVSTFVRRELAAIQSFQTSPWFAVLLVALAGMFVLRSALPRTRPMQVTLVALGVSAFLGTFLNDSGVSVAGAMAAVAWPAYLILLGPVTAMGRGGTAERPRPPRRASTAT